MVRFLRLAWHTLAFVGLATAGVAVWMWSQGISAKPDPPALESALARRARHLLIPAADRARTNPEPDSPEGMTDARAHWADHCASCHGSDGRGQTEMGRGLYPKAPDMTGPDSQSLSDGELFYIIEHGVKLTGMPGWGTGSPDGERSSWRLVRLVRRLPRLTEDEIAEIESLVPVGPEAWQQREAERRFLEGEAAKPVEPAPAHDHRPK